MGHEQIISTVEALQADTLFDDYYERINRLAYLCAVVKKSKAEERQAAISQVYFCLASVRALPLPLPYEQNYTFFKLLLDVHDGVLTDDEGNLLNFNENDVGGLSDAIGRVFYDLPLSWSYEHRSPLFPFSSHAIPGHHAHKTGRYILSEGAPLVRNLSRRDKNHNQFDKWYELLFNTTNRVIAIGEVDHDFRDYFTSSQSSNFEVKNVARLAQEITFDLINIGTRKQKEIKLFYLNTPENKPVFEDPSLLKRLIEFISHDNTPVLIHSGFKGKRASEMVLSLQAYEYLKMYPLIDNADEEEFCEWFHRQVTALRLLRFACESQQGVLDALQGALSAYETIRLFAHPDEQEEVAAVEALRSARKPVSSSYAHVMGVLGGPSHEVHVARAAVTEPLRSEALSSSTPRRTKPPVLPFSILMRSQSCSPLCRTPSPFDVESLSPCSPVST